mgnify:CR=1 FL=1
MRNLYFASYTRNNDFKEFVTTNKKQAFAVFKWASKNPTCSDVSMGGAEWLKIILIIFVQIATIIFVAMTLTQTINGLFTVSLALMN